MDKLPFGIYKTLHTNILGFEKNYENAVKILDQLRKKTFIGPLFLNFGKGSYLNLNQASTFIACMEVFIEYYSNILS